MEFDFENLPNFIEPTLILAGGLLAGYLLYHVIFYFIKRSGVTEEGELLTSIHRNLMRPARLFFPLLLGLLSISYTDLSPEATATVTRIFQILVYTTGAWLLVECTDVVGDLIRNHYRLDVEDNLEGRKIVTQLQFVKRLVAIVVSVVAIAIILMQFDTVREVGAGLLTSAGIAGIVVGLAAQRSIGNLLAGYQVAFAQPIRIDDVVIVEGEWGRIEEITMTYVVVRIWDQRRLVVPLSYFIEKPFQNWTRQSAELLGTIYLYTDYRVSVDAVREELTRILEQTDLWDKRVNGVQVTDTSPTGVELRALVSAADASKAWDLRCFVREQLIKFIQREYPESLARTRVELQSPAEPNGKPQEAHSTSSGKLFEEQGTGLKSSKD